MRGHEAETLTCRFGGGCRQGLNCPYRHSQEEIQIFVDERDMRGRKLLIRCGFCARGGSASSMAVVHGLCALLQRSRMPPTRATSPQIPTTALTTAARVTQATAGGMGEW